VARIAFLLAVLCGVLFCVAGYAGLLPPSAVPYSLSQLDIPAIGARVKAALSPQKPTTARATGGPVRVSVGTVKVEDVPIYLSGIGTVQAYNTVSVKTRVDGQIVKILFEEGQDVNEGDPLAIIDPRPYEAQLHQQEAMRLKDQAQLDGAVLDLNRYENLVKTSAISRQQLDQQRATVEQLRAQLENDAAQIEFARTQVAYTTIRAPINGRAGIRQVDQGNIVRFADNSVIVVLTQLKPISVVFTLASSLVAQGRMTLGKVKVPVVAYASDNTTELDRGTIDLVDNQVDQTTGTIKLKASFSNTQLRLWPGNFVNGRLMVDTRHQGLTVPSEAVRHGPGSDFVWVVRSDKTVEFRRVEIVGQAPNGRTLLTRGVNRGEQVVTEGHFLLDNSARVEIPESVTTSEGSQPVAADFGKGMKQPQRVQQ
jgi:multidrug efflux system membrane fusion protein